MGEKDQKVSLTGPQSSHDASKKLDYKERADLAQDVDGSFPLCRSASTCFPPAGTLVSGDPRITMVRGV